MKRIFVRLLVLCLLTACTGRAATYALGTSAILVGPAGGSSSVVLAVTPETGTWQAATNSIWLHLDDRFQNGVGSTNIIFTFDPNLGATRSGTLSVADLTLSITQAGSTYALSAQLASLVNTGLFRPGGVALDATGNVYIADNFNKAVKVWFVRDNSATTLVSSGLSDPGSVAVDTAGNVYIADITANAIMMWKSSTSELVPLLTNGLAMPNSVALDTAGNLYIADTLHNAIKEWMPGNSNLITLVSSGLYNPRGVAVDAAGNVYTADTANNAIKEWMPANGSVTTLVSSGLKNPFGVAVDGSGIVYIADTYHNAIKELRPGTTTPVAILSAGLNTPCDVAVDAAGNVYIADTLHEAIDELQFGFVDPTPKLQGMAAGSDNEPGVLPSTANLNPPFAPTTDQLWLTITGVSNGVVSFAFTADSGPARTAHLQLLGQTIPITQGIVGTPAYLGGFQVLTNGAVQFSFTNDPSAAFTVLSTTNAAWPMSDWTVLGPITNVSSGIFQFISQPPPNDAHRYYRVRSP